MTGMRNNSIELLRDLLMLGICVLHSCSLGGYRVDWFSRMLCPCVPCFVFISGYYGIKTTPARIAKTIAIAFAGVPMVGLVAWLSGGGVFKGMGIAASGVVDNWFVWAYVGLMCFAPALNHALDSEKRLSLTLPIIGMCLGWGYLKGLPWFRTFMPTTDGLGGYTFTMMVGTYLVAGLWSRFSRVEHIERIGALRIINFRHGSTPILILLLAISTTLCIAGFSAYCSPVSVFWSAMLFTIFSRITINGRYGAIAAFVAKSTFPIFVMHANGVGFGLIRRFANLLCDEYGLCVYAMYLIVGMTVFIVGLLLDMPRRLIAHLLRYTCQIRKFK